MDVSIKKPHYIETKRGIKIWELIADSANHLKKERATLFNHFKLTFFTKEGKKHILTGDRGKVKDETKDIEVRGNITAILEGGYVIKTDALKYDSEKRKIYGDGMVYINGPNVKIVGKGVLIDLDKEKFILLKNVKTKIVR